MGRDTFLKSIPAFSELKEADARSLSEHLKVETHPAGTVIVRGGEVGDAMYIIHTGEVRVPVLDERGREKFVARLGPGAFFGEMALLTGEPRTADVHAETEVELFVIERNPLQELLATNPQIGSFLTELLGKRLLEDDAIRHVGKYTLVGELGRGGMAIVFEGLHPTLSTTVAIKMLSHELVYEQGFRERFKNEAKIIANLDHENIVKVYDQEEKFATYFIIMEKIKGTVLSRLIETRGVLPYDQVRSILCQLSRALDYAHRNGVIHRDVKPSNVILDADGKAKLMDFGIAKTALDPELDEEVIGTAEYMAPEHILRRKMDGRADIYSLGVMAYEMLAGRVPFEGHTSRDVLRQHVSAPVPSPRAVRPDVPDDLEDFVLRATRKDPAERFRTCQEIVDLICAGDSKRLLRVDQARMKVLTLVFDPASEAKVNELVERFCAATLKIPGMRVGASDARLV